MTDGLFEEPELPATEPPADIGADMAMLDLTSEQWATFQRLARDPRALLDCNKARLEQVTRFKHSDESDALEPLDWFARKARDYCGDAIDHARRGGDPEQLRIARLKLVKAGALILAGIDRLDMVLDRQQESSI